MNSLSTATDIKTALNDLPTLYSNLVLEVNDTSSNSDDKVFKIKFSADLGDVPLIQKTSGFVIFNSTEVVQGVSSGKKFQLVIEDVATRPFDVKDTAANVRFYFILLF